MELEKVYTNRTVEKDGKIYYRCQACGRLDIKSFGYELDCYAIDHFQSGQANFCRDCANKIVPIMERADKAAQNMIMNIKNEARRKAARR